MALNVRRVGKVREQVKNIKGLSQVDDLGLSGFVHMDIEVAQDQKVAISEGQGGDCLVNGFQEGPCRARRPINQNAS